MQSIAEKFRSIGDPNTGFFLRLGFWLLLLGFYALLATGWVVGLPFLVTIVLSITISIVLLLGIVTVGLPLRGLYAVSGIELFNPETPLAITLVWIVGVILTVVSIWRIRRASEHAHKEERRKRSWRGMHEWRGPHPL